MNRSGRPDPDVPPAGGEPDAPPPEAPPATLYDLLHPWTLLFLALGCTILYQVVTAALWGSGHLLLGLLAAPLLGVVAPVWTVVRHLGLSPRRELQLHVLPWRDLLHVVWILAATLPPAYALSSLNTRLVEPSEDALRLFEELVPRDAATFVAGLLSVVVFAPLAEEMVFRGLVLNVFGRHMQVPAALLLSGALFGASHGALWMMLPITFLGVILGLVAWGTGTLTAAWLGHALFNLAGYIEISVTRDPVSSRLETWSTSPLVLGVSLILLGAGLATLFRRREPVPEQWDGRTGTEPGE